MTDVRQSDTRTHRPLGPPRLLARLLGQQASRPSLRTWPGGHGPACEHGDPGCAPPAAAGPYCLNLRLLLPGSRR